MGCVRTSPLPDAGACAQRPEDVYDWGDLGIGTCLAGPTRLVFVPDPSQPNTGRLVVLNSNRERNFNAASVLSIDWSSVDTALPWQTMDQLDAKALTLPGVVTEMGIDLQSGRALIPTRHSILKDGSESDHVLLVDLGLGVSDAPQPLGGADTFWDGFPALAVGVDPTSVDTFGDGLAGVLSTSSNELHFVDLRAQPPVLVDAVGAPAVGMAQVLDADGSGTLMEVQGLALDANRAASTEEWVFRYLDGSRVLALADDAPEPALERWVSINDSSWQLLPGGPDWMPATLGSEDQGGVRAGATIIENGQPVLFAEVVDDLGESRIFRSIGTGIGRQWTPDDAPFIEGADWYADGVGEPSVSLSGGEVSVFFTAGVTPARSIGLVTMGSAFDDAGSPEQVWLGDGVFDASEVFAPSVLSAPSLGGTLLYYTGVAGNGVTDIGLAIAGDTEPFVGVGPVLPPPAGWDADGRAYAAVSVVGSELRMLYWGLAGGVWQLGRATSWDGRTWQVHGPVAGISARTEPSPLSMVHRNDGGFFRIERENGDVISEVLWLGVPFEGAVLPMRMGVLGDAILDRGGRNGPDWQGMRHPGLIADPDVPGGYLGVYASEGLHLAQSVDGRTWTRWDALSMDTSAFAEVDDPALFDDGADIWLYFAAHQGDGTWRMYRAQRVGPLDFSAPEPINLPNATWDDVAQRGPAPLLVGTTLHLFYGGGEGTTSGIGHAVFDGSSWARSGGLPSAGVGQVLERGVPGTFDDAAVADPSVLHDGTQFQMWYTAFDGGTTQIGFASSDDGDGFTRFVNDDGMIGPVIAPGAGHTFDGVSAPSAIRTANGHYLLLTQGSYAGLSRLGAWYGAQPTRLHRVTRQPTTGDEIRINTTAGDTEDISSLWLGDGERPVGFDGNIYTGSGLGRFVSTPDSRFGLVTNTIADHIFVIDLDAADEADTNLYGFEAALKAASADASGTRAAVVSQDGRWLYAGQSPGNGGGGEGVLVFDLTKVDDDARADAVTDALVATVALPRGSESDAGDRSTTSLGPIDMVLGPSAPGMPDERYLYVAHYNANRLVVIDLWTGTRPLVVREIDTLGEEPAALALSPDGRHLVVAHLIGQLDDNVAHSTLSIIDVDPASPTWFEVVGRIGNREAR